MSEPTGKPYNKIIYCMVCNARFILPSGMGSGKKAKITRCEKHRTRLVV